MDEPDASHGVSELLNKFIAIQLQFADSASARARLKRAAFTVLLGLDKNEEVKHSRSSHSYNRSMMQRSAKGQGPYYSCIRKTYKKMFLPAPRCKLPQSALAKTKPSVQDIEACKDQEGLRLALISVSVPAICYVWLVLQPQYVPTAHVAL